MSEKYIYIDCNTDFTIKSYKASKHRSFNCLVTLIINILILKRIALLRFDSSEHTPYKSKDK
jgi:hypothetical protein